MQVFLLHYWSSLLIGERERANLVVQLARFFYICRSPRAPIPNKRNVNAMLDAVRMCCCSTPHARALTKGFAAPALQFSPSYTSPMDAECPTANVQPTLEDGATPSGSSHCATDARERTLAWDHARRRERLASETAEERRSAQRRIRRCVYAIISWIAPARQKCTALCSKIGHHVLSDSL